MALIKCPECDQTVSDKALKCPKCGYPIQEHLNHSEEKVKDENNNVTDTFVQDDCSISIMQTSTHKNGHKKIIIAALIVCVSIVAVLVIVFALQKFMRKLTVEDITINKWRLIDSTNYSDIYEGTITSEQKMPFVAVIGQYTDEKSAPQFVYVEDGVGVIQTYESTDEDPSVKYRPIGYLEGNTVDDSNIKVKYTDSNYYDWSFSESSSCDVLIEMDMNNTKTGLLVFDIINETNNDTEKNMVATVIDGKLKYSYYADLPYKARGIDVSIAPKLFCESATITQNDYMVEQAYTAEKYESSYFNSYSGKEILFFDNYANGFVLYTRELKEGGNKEHRNTVDYLSTFLCNGECTLTTYDYVDEGESILMPKYEFNIVGYVTWNQLEKETI